METDQDDVLDEDEPIEPALACEWEAWIDWARIEKAGKVNRNFENMHIE